ncbi:hypothetical protein SKAU_G00123400 [Synaphobranchus kaupii]|uniref:Uncharacterized protein n=1 Tax=Synaphobranchus kaupii TaxID=118154 RepID=A0A9Q1FPD7_SYNKA|nr:hypothetical protein SKAU_G00123400 [Synaphobranchus kaupii]
MRERSESGYLWKSADHCKSIAEFWGSSADCFLGVSDAAASWGGPRSMVSSTMKAMVDAVWAVWSIGASIYDYLNTSAMEERIHALENVITIHQCVIGALSAGLVILFTYILLRKH